jgi:SAM-dependent methyltransferase
MQSQQLNFFTRVSFHNRLKILRNGGLKQGQRILDYGCGNGNFVRYLRNAGYDVTGYDAYFDEHSDRSTLSRQFDVLICQDVIEHSPEPFELLREWFTLLGEGGLLFIGTPNADDIDLNKPELYSLEIHQPFHRHILSKRALLDACANAGFRALACTNKFYLDTRIPCNNVAFARAYIARSDGVLEAAFEPPVFSALLSPKLFLLALFGSFIQSSGNMLCIFEKASLSAAVHIATPP